MSRLQIVSAALGAVLVLGACSAKPTAPADARIPVITTISTFNSLVEAVGGNHVTVKSLVPVGASPEEYEPTPQDAATLSQARLLVENGAGLETWLARTITNAGSPNLQIVVGSAGLKVDGLNPHVWMDPQNAKQYVFKIRDALIALDPTNERDYRANAAAYAAKPDALTRNIAAK